MPTPRVTGPCCNPTIEQKEFVGSKVSRAKAPDTWMPTASADHFTAHHAFLQDWTSDWEHRCSDMMHAHFNAIVELLQVIRTEVSSGGHLREAATAAVAAQAPALAEKVAELCAIDMDVAINVGAEGTRCMTTVASTARCDHQGRANGDAELKSPRAPVNPDSSAVVPCNVCSKAFDVRPCLVPPLNASATPYIRRQLDAQKEKRLDPDAAFRVRKPSDARSTKGPGGRISQESGEEKPPELLDKVLNAVESNVFRMFTAFLIIGNTCASGLQVDINVKRAFETPIKDVPDVFKSVDVVFCCLFSVELVLRVLAYRSRFLFGPEWRWNVFDSLLVFSQYLEWGVGDNVDMSAIRVMRLARLIRTLRIIKVVPFFQKLRMMVCCIYNSLMSLMWSLVLLSLVMYLFAIICVQATINHLRAGDGGVKLASYGDDLAAQDLREKLWTNYRTLPRAMLSMLMTISGGMDWYEMAQPLMCIHWSYAIMFAGFISFVIVGVMNVLSAVFVENALQIRDRDLLIQSQIEESEGFVQDMAELFNEADYNRNGALTEVELSKYLKNERIVAYMQGYDLDIADFGSIFSLMDQDGNGSVGLDEFVLGMMKLKGKARCLDVMRLFQCLEQLETHLSEMQTCYPNRCVECGSDPKVLALTARQEKRDKKQSQAKQSFVFADEDSEDEVP